jgi:hypothetical protein
LNGLSVLNGTFAFVAVGSELGEVSGEVPPHERHSTPIDAMLHLTIRTTGYPSRLGLPH